MRIITIALVVAACGGSVPETRFYQLASTTKGGEHSGAAALAVEALSTDGAYDDERMVYRVNPYRLDYYNYHRWSAAPGTLIGNYIQQAFAKSGRFRAVVHEASEATPVVLGGRVVALEEVDSTTTKWQGRIVIELTLTDNATNQVLWSEQFEETESLPVQTPEGLARAISVALDRIVKKAVPAVAEVAERQTQVHEARAAQRAMRIR
jgi:ABC-type uncharacterized transport system auxiliary subunit